MSSYAGGINVNNEIGKADAGGSYFFNYLDHAIKEERTRENFLPGEQFTFSQRSNQNNNNGNHRVNYSVDAKLDSLNSLKFTGAAVYNSTNVNVESRSETFDNEHRTLNEGTTVSSLKGNNISLNSNLLWRHKFAKKGRTFSSNVGYSFSDGDQKGSINSMNHFFQPEDSTYVLSQFNTQSTLQRRVNTELTYTEPVGKRKYLAMNYNYSTTQTNVDRDVYDERNEELEYNDRLSQAYTSNYQFHRTGLSFRMVKRSYNLLIAADYQKSILTGKTHLLDVNINRDFENLLPSLRFNYDFSNTRHFSFDYETSVRQPTIQQLQPVVDNSDPLNVYKGNPRLRPSFNQSFRSTYRTFNPVSMISFFAFVDADVTQNAIVNSQLINEQLTRTIVPVNVDQTVAIRSDANISFPVSAIASRFTVGANFTDVRSIAVLNELNSNTIQKNLGLTFRYSYRLKEIFDVNLSADLDRNNTHFSFNSTNQSYINGTYTAEFNSDFLKVYHFNSVIEYLTFNNVSSNFTKAIPLMHLSISRFILKNNSGEMKFGVSNLFNKALGINQTTTVNYNERTISNSLGRFYMLTFTYALNKQLNPMGGRPKGGMIRIIR